MKVFGDVSTNSVGVLVMSANEWLLMNEAESFDDDSLVVLADGERICSEDFELSSLSIAGDGPAKGNGE